MEAGQLTSWRVAMAPLVLAASLIVVACSPAPRRPSPPREAPVVQPVEPPAHITVAAVGDIMLGTDYPQNILPDDDGIGFLRDVTPLLSAADVAFGNLEGVLMDGGEAVKQCESEKSCFVFRMPTRYAAYLRDAGFDVLSLANNHARDFGESGIESTMRTLDAVGILHSGSEGDVASWITRGRRMAMIAFAPNVGAHQLNDVSRASELVRGLAELHDIVIVSFHGGAEGEGAESLPFTREFFYGEDRGNVVEFARAMVNAGADLVLGHGPHILRAMELYRDRLIAYSLGNFATYYGISVEGNRGIGAILFATLAEDGRFLHGRIESTIQVRPDGPRPDPERRGLHTIRALTRQAFPCGSLDFGEDGTLSRKAQRASGCDYAPERDPTGSDSSGATWVRASPWDRALSCLDGAVSATFRASSSSSRSAGSGSECRNPCDW